MRRVLPLVLLLCLLLAGCTALTDNGINPPLQNTDATSTTTGETTLATAPSEDASIDGPAAVTVYLLDRVNLYDSGYTQYYYDENGNIDYYDMMTIENELRYSCRFEEPDANGMPCKVRLQWDAETVTSTTLRYYADGKLQEAQEDGTNYTGYQYAYNAAGNLSEKREYYDGMLQSEVRCEYDGDVLSGVFCENADGEAVYECLVKNGRIAEKISYEYEYDSRVFYEYDAQGNLIKITYLADGETEAVESYSYKTIETDANHAQYLCQQQAYLLSII